MTAPPNQVNTATASGQTVAGRLTMRVRPGTLRASFLGGSVDEESAFGRRADWIRDRAWSASAAPATDHRERLSGAGAARPGADAREPRGRRHSAEGARA